MYFNEKNDTEIDDELNGEGRNNSFLNTNNRNMKYILILIGSIILFIIGIALIISSTR